MCCRASPPCTSVHSYRDISKRLSLGPAPCSAHSASIGSVWAQKGPGGDVRVIKSGGGVLSWSLTGDTVAALLCGGLGGREHGQERLASTTVWQ